MDVKKLTVRNEAAELEQIREFVDKLGQEWNFEAFSLNLVLEEYIHNLISYGYTDNLPHEISIEINREGNQLRVSVSDDGNPYDITELPENEEIHKPLEERKIGGLGIHFIRTLANEIVYRSSKGINTFSFVMDSFSQHS
jgi:anti-sigma regulatory factor (Ser/Thr protein kinase)